MLATRETLTADPEIWKRMLGKSKEEIIETMSGDMKTDQIHIDGIDKSIKGVEKQIADAISKRHADLIEAIGVSSTGSDAKDATHTKFEPLVKMGLMPEDKHTAVKADQIRTWMTNFLTKHSKQFWAVLPICTIGSLRRILSRRCRRRHLPVLAGGARFFTRVCLRLVPARPDLARLSRGRCSASESSAGGRCPVLIAVVHQELLPCLDGPGRHDLRTRAAPPTSEEPGVGRRALRMINPFCQALDLGAAPVLSSSYRGTHDRTNG